MCSILFSSYRWGAWISWRQFPIVKSLVRDRGRTKNQSESKAHLSFTWSIRMWALKNEGIFYNDLTGLVLQKTLEPMCLLRLVFVFYLNKSNIEAIRVAPQWQLSYTVILVPWMLTLTSISAIPYDRGGTRPLSQRMVGHLKSLDVPYFYYPSPFHVFYLFHCICVFS